MAEDCVNHACALAGLPRRTCVTRTLKIHGHHQDASRFGALAVYGSDASLIRDLVQAEPQLGAALHAALPYVGAEVIWATRHEMARTVEDVLARRTRALFLNTRAALDMSPQVAELMVRELGRDGVWQDEQVRVIAAVASSYRTLH